MHLEISNFSERQNYEDRKSADKTGQSDQWLCCPGASLLEDDAAVDKAVLNEEQVWEEPVWDELPDEESYCFEGWGDLEESAGLDEPEEPEELEPLDELRATEESAELAVEVSDTEAAE